MDDTKLISNLYPTSLPVFIVPLMQTALNNTNHVSFPPHNPIYQKGGDAVLFQSQMSSKHG